MSSAPAASAVTGCGSSFRRSGLGHSATAQTFAVSSLAEAVAYLAHPTLGSRLRECFALVASIEGRSVDEIFDDPDDLKFHSSMTLFAHAAPQEPIFAECLQKYFGGQPDPRTIARIPGSWKTDAD